MHTLDDVLHSSHETLNLRVQVLANLATDIFVSELSDWSEQHTLEMGMHISLLSFMRRRFQCLAICIPGTIAVGSNIHLVPFNLRISFGKLIELKASILMRTSIWNSLRLRVSEAEQDNLLA